MLSLFMSFFAASLLVCVNLADARAFSSLHANAPKSIPTWMQLTAGKPPSWKPPVQRPAVQPQQKFVPKSTAPKQGPLVSRPVAKKLAARKKEVFQRIRKDILNSIGSLQSNRSKSQTKKYSVRRQIDNVLFMSKLRADVSAKLPGSGHRFEVVKKNVGFTWKDPRTPEENHVRIDQGNRLLKFKSQRVDHVVVVHDGKRIGRDGRPVSQSTSAEQWHIPYSQWVRWRTWYAP